MKRLSVELFVVLVAVFLQSATAFAQQADSPAIPELRVLVYAENANVLRSNPGPLKDALIRFMRMLTDETTKNLYAANIYAGPHVPEKPEDSLLYVLNAANANRLLQLTIAPGPDPVKDPHFVVSMNLGVVERGPKYQPNAPHFIISKILWKRSFRLEGDASLTEAAKTMGAEGAREVIAILKP